MLSSATPASALHLGKIAITIASKVPVKRALQSVPRCTRKESAKFSEKAVKVPTNVAPRPPVILQGSKNAMSTAAMAICATVHKKRWPAPLS